MISFYHLQIFQLKIFDLSPLMHVLTSVNCTRVLKAPPTQIRPWCWVLPRQMSCLRRVPWPSKEDGVKIRLLVWKILDSAPRPRRKLQKFRPFLCWKSWPRRTSVFRWYISVKLTCVPRGDDLFDSYDFIHRQQDEISLSCFPGSWILNLDGRNTLLKQTVHFYSWSRTYVYRQWLLIDCSINRNIRV